jgi:hypothetical protein
MTDPKVVTLVSLGAPIDVSYEDAHQAWDACWLDSAHLIADRIIGDVTTENAFAFASPDEVRAEVQRRLDAPETMQAILGLAIVRAVGKESSIDVYLRKATCWLDGPPKPSHALFRVLQARRNRDKVRVRRTTNFGRPKSGGLINPPNARL